MQNWQEFYVIRESQKKYQKKLYGNEEKKTDTALKSLIRNLNRKGRQAFQVFRSTDEDGDEGNGDDNSNQNENEKYWTM